MCQLMNGYVKCGYKKQNTDIYYDMDEPQKYAAWRSQTQSARTYDSVYSQCQEKQLVWQVD
jgi:DUF2075 family protein